jgi:GNAT superfamily N-acetyltransferase
MIRDLVADDYDAWRPLWDGYCDFYETAVPEDVTSATWAAVLDQARPVLGRGACRADGRLIGFSHSVIHPSTWRIGPSCYLEDLFVDPARRGGGVGRALIDDLIGLVKERGWTRLYWHTRRDNAVARRLYDRYVQADEFVRYRIEPCRAD